MKELGEFKEKTETGNKEDLKRELLEIDKKAQAKAQAKKLQSYDIPETVTNEDKRLEMYRKMRDDIMRDDSIAKTEHQKQKIEELNAKMAQMELAKKEKEEQIRQMEREEEKRRQSQDAKKS